MSTGLWIMIGAGAVIIAAVLGSSAGKEGRSAEKKAPYRIDRPHVVEPEDYECSVCHKRFRKNVMVCPLCGARFAGRVKDSREFDDEEEELEAWDEE